MQLLRPASTCILIRLAGMLRCRYDLAELLAAPVLPHFACACWNHPATANIEAHSGKLSASRNVGAGATFAFKLPARAAGVASEAFVRAAGSTPGGGCHVSHEHPEGAEQQDPARKQRVGYQG